MGANPSSLSLAGKVAVVTGARQGIGRAIAQELGDHGAKVVIVDLSPADETVASISDGGGAAVSMICDVADREAVAELPTLVAEAYGPCDVLINNAAMQFVSSFIDLDEDRWRAQMSVNLDGVFRTAKAFVPAMIDRGWGRIINVASSSIYTNFPGLSGYMAGKAGVLGFTSGLANELGVHGITVNAVSPGFTKTPSLAGALEAGALPPQIMDVMREATALKRDAQPEDVAGLVRFLASDDARAITGQFLVADGGLTRHY